MCNAYFTAMMNFAELMVLYKHLPLTSTQYEEIIRYHTSRYNSYICYILFKLQIDE